MRGLGVLLVMLSAAVAGLGCGNTAPVMSTLAGRPLLGGDEPFEDVAAGIRFQPPKNWSMQARATTPPGQQVDERLIVKYKRLIPGLDPAWIRVSYAPIDPAVSLSDFARQRKPARGYTLLPGAEEFSHKGLPAVRVFQSGRETDGAGVERPFTCELVVIRKDKRAYLFAGYFVTADAKGKERIRKALETVELEPASKPTT